MIHKLIIIISNKIIKLNRVTREMLKISLENVVYLEIRTTTKVLIIVSRNSFRNW